jgi:DNA sulfur modification protein DndD
MLLSTDTEIRQDEVEQLRKNGAITREYLLDYNAKARQTSIKEGYFW